MIDFAELIPRFKTLIPQDPAGWAERLFYEEDGKHIWRSPGHATLDQSDIVALPFRYQKSALGSGHGVAKTESVSLMIALWMLSHFPSAYVVVSSASWISLEDRIFASLRNKINRLDPDHRVFPEVGVNKWKWGDEFAVIGISPDRPEVAQGWHNTNGTLVIWDEASCIENASLESILSVIKTRLDSIVLLGNPIRAEGPYADILRRERKYKDWWTGHISSEDTPNYVATRDAIQRGEMTDEEACSGKELIAIPGLASYSQVRNWELNGRQSIIFCTRALGIPPDQSQDTLIPISAVDGATKAENQLEREVALRLLVDVALSEVGNKTALAVAGEFGLYKLDLRLGWGPGKMIQWLYEHATGRAGDFAGKPITEIRIDAGGSGGTVYRAIKEKQDLGEEWLQEIEVIPIYGGINATQETEYFNVRAECWVGMRDALKSGFYLPPSSRDDLICMTSVKYGADDRNRIKLEPKESYVRRNGFSPDGPDALSFNFANFTEHQAWKGLVCDIHKAKYGVSLEKVADRWMVNFVGIPEQYARAGMLYRSIWYSRRSGSGMLIAHLDDAGCWTIVKALRWKNKSLREVAQGIATASRDLSFSGDWMSAAEDIDIDNQVRVWDVMTEELISRKLIETPFWMESARLKGLAGLDVIDRLLLGSLARWPKHPYWNGRQDSPKNYLEGGMLTIAAPELWQELRRARFKAKTSKSVWEGDEPPPEDLVGGGGPLVLCLRMLAIGGVGIYV